MMIVNIEITYVWFSVFKLIHDQINWVAVIFSRRKYFSSISMEVKFCFWKCQVKCPILFTWVLVIARTNIGEVFTVVLFIMLFLPVLSSDKHLLTELRLIFEVKMDGWE